MFVDEREIQTLRKGHEINIFNYQKINNLRSIFLDKLRSDGKTAYKRYLGTPLRYAGGKSLATGFLVELLPDNISSLVSPFFGGGSFEIACAKELQLEVTGYDIFALLVNYWQVLIEDPQGLHDILAQFKPTREEFVRIKNILKAHWEQKEIIEDKTYLAALYYYNHNTSYGPHFLGSPSSVYLSEARYNILLNKIKTFDVKNMVVQCMSFEKSIPLHRNDFLYCDPPYYLGEGSKTFVGLYPHRNFPIYHKGFDHEKLRDLLLSHKAGFILSYNLCPTIVEWYKDCYMYSPKWQYTFSQGDTRIGKNRLMNNNGSHIKDSHELLIWRMPQIMPNISELFYNKGVAHGKPFTL